MAEERNGAALVGRQRERLLLEQALDSARLGSGGSVTVLRGEPGIGKTALLDWTAGRAGHSGFTVLRAAGHASEAGVAFGVLNQVLLPLRSLPGPPAGQHSDPEQHTRPGPHPLPGAQQDALDRVLGLRAGLPPDGFMVGAAALALLADRARRGPVLVLVDDLHWVDPSSAAVLAFVRQRICGLRAALVCTSRPDPAAPEGWSGQPVDIGALSGEDSRLLLRRWHPGLAGSTAERVAAEAEGNPLALAELPGQLADEQITGVVPLPDRLPLGQRLETHFARRLADLPPQAAELLLRAALDGPGAARAVTPLPRAGAEEPAVAHTLDRERTEVLLDRIEASGLARLDEAGRLVFRHPLVGSAVIGAATQDQRRGAHRALASRMHGADPRRLLHEAAAAEGYDESLAVRLQEAGEHLALRGGDAEAARLLDRAAGLSADPGNRVRRLTWAAVMSARGGRLAYAARLVETLRRQEVPQDVAPLFAYAVVYVDQSHHIDFASTFSLLPGALDALTRADGREHGPGGARAGRVHALHDLVEQMVFKLLLATVYTGDPRGTATLGRYRHHLSPAAALCLRAWADPPRTAHGAHADLLTHVERASTRREAGNAWLLLWAATAVDGAGPELWRLFSGEHAYATRGSVAKSRCYQAFLEGRWDMAGECLAEADTAEDRGYHCNALLFRHYHAHFLAGRGDERGLHEVRERIGARAASARMRFVTDHLDRLDALAAMAHGRYAEAYAGLCRASAGGDGVGTGELPLSAALFRPVGGPSWFHLTFFDLVLAGVRSGHREQVRTLVAAGRAARMDEISGHHHFLLAAATALSAAVDEGGADGGTDGGTGRGSADAAYAAAYAVPDAGRWVFDLARLRLAHGSWLRSRGRPEEASGPLRAALRAFEDLDAAPWADQCRAELRTTQVPPARTANPAPDTGHSPLTVQELRIARLVATGLTNREVGAELRLSHRTVSAHLYRIFPKLGITSRAALARALPDG
ncbi:AAA family ATPase [Streptomyces sp. NPDC091272]|uniref:helix-turn-helix transcriptional regulator n=1 Tax=Streptomyces sp. NPDC091272 TaxID=3365981 RepID=UPI0037F4EB9B